MSAEIISMINWKGGVGKSTLSLHLAVGLMRRKKSPNRPKVLLIDLDPQCNLSYLSLGVSKYVDSVYKNGQLTLKDIFDNYFDGKPFSTKDAIIKEPITSSPGKVWSNVDILPSHSDLVLVDMRLARERKSGTTHQEETKFELDKVSIIHEAIKQVEDDYDYIVLDCPPNINLVTQNSFFASQHYLIPAIPDFLSTVGISMIKSEMVNLNKNFTGMIGYSGADVDYSDATLLGIIFNMVDEYGGGPKSTHEDTIESVKNQHKDMVFDAYITDGDGIAVAADNNMTVYSFDSLPKSKSNAEKQSDYLDAVVDELLTKV
ncbi:AAA family ATPase [Pseudoalteromonas carrageenovora]|uniref:ParA family protein n=1 Tax=Pseudoalteromonas TaxID=53246 RepID=UPI0026E2F5D9|nr:AAA family ATPase [Pseudoalteromonas carrageenovora]MDO6636027.1 AAA family ATPase [Pseudoalteromonas carrageenovora]MDO6646954.1 AAA family ATPase [Pseudoalteromonas carrageenovora]